MALPCLSSAADPDIRLSAESLFEKLAYLDGDGVWLLLLQTLDTANTTVAASTAATSSAAQDRGQYLSSGRRASGASPIAGTAGTTAGSSSSGGGGVGVFLPDLLVSSCAAIPGLVRGRPSVLAEIRSVFSGGRVAAECAPSAAMLLGLLSADGSVAEHM